MSVAERANCEDRKYTSPINEESVNGYMMADVFIGLPNSYKVRTLIDTGAMPSIISEDIVPLGSTITPSTVTLTGVSNAKIKVAGETTLIIELGDKLFTQKLIVVPVGAMAFPQQSRIILGNNFLTKHRIGVDPSKWTLIHNSQYLADMLPALIEDTLYSPIMIDINQHPQHSQAQINTDVLTVDRTANRDADKIRSMPVFQRRAEAHLCKTDTEPTPVMPGPPLRPAGCTRDSDNTLHETADLKDPGEFPEDAPYAVFPCAFYEIKTGTQEIKVRLQHKDSPHAIMQDEANSYIVCSNMYMPGVLVQDTIASGVLTVSVRNMNAQPALLARDIPIAYGYRYSEPEEVATILTESDNKPLRMEDPRAQVILTISSLSELTERAFDGKPDDETDMLDEFMEYDPSEVIDKEVVYDESRFQKVLELLDIDKWELTQDQKDRAIEMLRRKQRAYHLKGEKLPKTHLLEHDIEFYDPETIIQNPPRWTPYKLRAPVEKEVEALLKMGLAFRSTHPHSSPIVLVKKKGVNDYRLCTD